MDIYAVFSSLLAILNAMSPYVLLGFFLAGLLHVFFKPSAMRRHFSGKGFGPVAKAALFGVPLPLCSCGVLPTAVSLKRSGASKGATTSFLIATPQTGVDSIAATWSLLGPAFAVVRPVAALAGAVAGGMAVSAADGDADEADQAGSSFTTDDQPAQKESFGKKMLRALKYGMVDMVASVGKWLVIGLVVAALITVVVPDDIFVSLAEHPILAMLLMVVVAVPMYVCATGSIPIAMSLMLKGLTPGVGFVLLMAGPAANFASVMVLRKSLGAKATAIYVGAVVATAMAFGIIIDYFLPRDWFMPNASLLSPDCHHSTPLFFYICSAVLVCLLAYAFISNRGHAGHSHGPSESAASVQVFKIDGMACPHCVAKVKAGLESLEGVKSVDVNLSEGTATVAGSCPSATITSKIESLGYDVIPSPASEKCCH